MNRLNIDRKRIFEEGATITVAVILITLVGAVIRWAVAGQDLFADELATYWIVSTRDLGGVIDTVKTNAEISPPLGFSLTWLTTRIELSPEFLRLPALIAGIGTIPIVYAIGTRTVGRRAAVLATALTALSPFMIFYSAEARGYGLMMAFVALSTLALLLAVEDGRRRWWLLYAVAICLAAYTHYTSIFALVAQFGWVFLTQPTARKPLLIASVAAALLYIPWLPSVQADLDSPTTLILAGLSPFTPNAVRFSLEHWALGLSLFPLRQIPGTASLYLLAAGAVSGALGLWMARERIRAWVVGGEDRWAVGLVFLLAVATPVGAALASAVGNDMFSTRNLAASWPYLALTAAALIAVGPRPVRMVTATLALVAFGLGAGRMLLADFKRPAFGDAAAFIDEVPGAAVVDAASLTPGPLANFDVTGAVPDAPVFRLAIPEQKERPFSRTDVLPDPDELAGRVVEEADGGPIAIVTNISVDTFPGAAASNALAADLVEQLPDDYELSQTAVFPGMFDIQVQVYAPEGEAPGDGQDVPEGQAPAG